MRSRARTSRIPLRRLCPRPGQCPGTSFVALPATAPLLKVPQLEVPFQCDVVAAIEYTIHGPLWSPRDCPDHVTDLGTATRRASPRSAPMPQQHLVSLSRLKHTLTHAEVGLRRAQAAKLQWTTRAPSGAQGGGAARRVWAVRTGVAVHAAQPGGNRAAATR